jgi:hypothetical protein
MAEFCAIFWKPIARFAPANRAAPLQKDGKRRGKRNGAGVALRHFVRSKRHSMR